VLQRRCAANNPSTSQNLGARVNFELSPEQTEIRDLCRKVGMEQFRPTAFSRRDFAIPKRNLELLGSLGLLGLALPEEHGGGGRPEIDAIIALQEIAHACPVTGDHAMMVLTGPVGFIAKWGSEEQKGRYIPDACAGRQAFSISLTEPEAGTAITGLKTRAEVRGDTCVVNGQKIFCSHATQADQILVFVRFAPGVEGIGAVIVAADAPGLTIGKAHRHASGAPWSELSFDDATVPAENVLFTGDAFQRLMASYSLERCGAAILTIGIAEIALEMAVAYAEARHQFGRPISDFQFVQGKLADMYIALEGAKLLVYRAIARADDGLPSRLDSSAAKVAATEAACLVTDLAMQIHGGAGMDQEMPLEWLYRCVRPYTVAGGTSDIHRSMIASELVERRFSHRHPAPVALDT
jgi:alkylation response protein AidB-like acyl-CoA dehydrogenase